MSEKLKSAADASSSQQPRRTVRLDLKTASELMTPKPVSISANAAIAEAVDLLTQRGFRAAPVIDAAGLPVGVVSQTDLLAYDRETMGTLQPERDESQTHKRARFRSDVVRDIMTPVVFSVPDHATADMVVEKLLKLKIHRLFVTDSGGALVGVISTLDILRWLHT